MINESEIIFVEETRQSKSFEATAGEIVTKFKSREIEGDQVVRRTTDGEYGWLTVAELCKNEIVRSKPIDPKELEQKLAEDRKQKAEELQKRLIEPLTFWESVFTALYGAGLGLFGLVFVWPQASRFKSDGYILKSRMSWRLYWMAFGARLAVVVILLIVVVATSH
jgi:vacuolar-type H+-ATPase subunit H